MSTSQTLDSMKGIARWCIEQQLGILTPTGRAKKIPTYYIVRCHDCEQLGLTDTGVAKAERFRCQQQQLSREKTKSSSRPRTIICRGEVEVVEEISPQEKGTHA